MEEAVLYELSNEHENESGGHHKNKDDHKHSHLSNVLQYVSVLVAQNGKVDVVGLLLLGEWNLVNDVLDAEQIELGELNHD